jgi:hypothetical protein
VIAEAVRAGEIVQASTFQFPAATTNVTPDFTAFATARSKPSEALPAMLMLATAGL